MKSYWQFINENISYDVDQTIFIEYDIDTEEWMGYTERALNLTSGKITFHKNRFKVDGTNGNGNVIEIDQEGEYDMYGGPYTPKMKLPIFKVNGIDVYPIVHNFFKEEGYIKNDNYVDMSNALFFPMYKIDNFVDLSEEERQNVLRSYKGLRKYDL